MVRYFQKILFPQDPEDYYSKLKTVNINFDIIKPFRSIHRYNNSLGGKEI